MTSQLFPTILESGQGETIILDQNTGWKVTVKGTKDRFTGLLDMWLETVPSGGGPIEHIHIEQDEFFWIVKGTFLFKAGEQVQQVSEGAWAHAPRGTAHTFRNIGEEAGEILIGLTPGVNMKEFFRGLSYILNTAPSDQKALEDLAKQYSMVVVGPPL